MAKVTCTRPNASEHISGVDFVRQEDGSVVAEGVNPELAAQFVDFEGFEVEVEVEVEVEAEAAAAAAAAAEAEAASKAEPASKKKPKADPVV